MQPTKTKTQQKNVINTADTSQIQQVEQKDQFEYKLVFINSNFITHSLSKDLNELGLNSWELISTMMRETDRSNTELIIILKRKL